MRRSSGIAVAVFCSGLILNSECRADQVTLKNGTQISGQIVKKDGANLSLKAPPIGDVTVPWAEVTAITSDLPVTVIFQDGRSVLGKLTSRDGQIQVEGIAVPLDQVGQIYNAAEKAKLDRLQHPPWTDLWAGFIDFGASLAKGNAEDVTVVTTINATRATLKDKTTAYFNQIYGRATIDEVTATNAQAWRTGWAYNRNDGHGLFFTLFNDYENDRFQDLDLRFVLGGGLGYKVIDSDRTKLDLIGGGAYNRENFANDFVRNAGEAFWGDDWSHKLTSSSSLKQSFRMFHNLTRTGEYRMNFDLGMATTLKKWLSWQLTISDRYLSDPVPGRLSNDVLFTTGLRITFAQ